MTTFYTKTGNPVDWTRGISKQIRDEFAAIETGFSLVNTDVQSEAASRSAGDAALDASKANIISPTLTGTPRAPTASTGSSGTQIATLDFVNNTAFASIANLPAQPGNANKVLTTDGTNPYWGSEAVGANPIVCDYQATLTFANGAPESIQAYYLDSDREFLIFAGSGHCAVFNRSTLTMGSVVAFKSVATSYAIPLVITANKILIVSFTGTSSTAMEAVVVDLSGTTCTVNTPATATLAGNFTTIGNLIAVGSTYVLSYGRATNVHALRGLTISGSTVTIGAEYTQTGSLTAPASLYAHDASTLMTFHGATTVYATPYTVSGTTLTVGTESSVAMASGTQAWLLHKFSGGKYLVTSDGASLVAFATLSGTVASWSGTTACYQFSNSTCRGKFTYDANNVGFSQSAGTEVINDSGATPTVTQLSVVANVPTATGFTQISSSSKTDVTITSSITYTSTPNDLPSGVSGTSTNGLNIHTNKPKISSVGGFLINDSKIIGFPNGTQAFTTYFDGSSTKLVYGKYLDVDASDSVFSGSGYSSIWIKPYQNSQSTTQRLIRRFSLQ